MSRATDSSTIDPAAGQPAPAWPVLGVAVLVGIAALRCLSPFSPFPYWDFDPTVVPASLLGLGPAVMVTLDWVALAVGLGLVTAAAARGDRLAWWLAGGLAAGTAAVAVHAAAPSLATLGSGRIGISWLAALGTAAGVAVACRDRWHGREARAVAIGLLAGVLAVLVLKGVVQVLVEHPRTVESFRRDRLTIFAANGWTPESPQALGYERRLMQNEPTGWFGLSNVFASFVAAGAVMFTCWLVARARPWLVREPAAPNESAGRLWGLVVGAMALACVGSLVLAGSKGGWGVTLLGVGVAVVWWLVRSRAGAGTLGRVTAALPLLACGAILAGVFARGLAGERLGELSLLFRWFYLEAAVRIFGSRPLLGVGPDGFKEAYLTAKNPLSPEEVQSPHCLPAEWLACLGVGGIALVAVAAVLAWRVGRAGSVSADEDGAGESASIEAARPVLRLVGLTAAVITLACLALERSGITPEGAAVRVAGLAAWATIGMLVARWALGREGAGLWQAVAAGATVLLAHSMIEVTATHGQAGGLMWAWVGLAAGAVGVAGGGGTQSVAAGAMMADRRGGTRTGRAVTLAVLAVVATVGGLHAVGVWRWEAGLARAAAVVRPLAEAGSLVQRLEAQGRATGGTLAEADMVETVRATLSNALDGVPVGTSVRDLRRALNAAELVLVPAAQTELEQAASRIAFDFATEREIRRLRARQAFSLVGAGQGERARELLSGAVWSLDTPAERYPFPARSGLAAWDTSLRLGARQAGLATGDQAVADLRRALVRAMELDPYNLPLALRYWQVVRDTVSSGDPLLDQAARAVLRVDDLQRLDAAVRGLTQEQRRIVEQSLRRD